MEKKISEIKKEFEMAGTEKLSELFAEYADDSRAGVAGLIRQYRKKEEALHKEMARIEDMKTYEREYERIGWVCGIDEAGRGPVSYTHLTLPTNSRV